MSPLLILQQNFFDLSISKFFFFFSSLFLQKRHYYNNQTKIMIRPKFCWLKINTLKRSLKMKKLLLVLTLLLVSNFFKDSLNHLRAETSWPEPDEVWEEIEPFKEYFPEEEDGAVYDLEKVNEINFLGTAYISYGEDTNGQKHNSLVNPIICLDGIDLDLEEKDNWADLYKKFNRENMLEDFKKEGFDIILLDFNIGFNFIQRHAFVLVSLINKVNQLIDSSEKLIVIGPSMGGLVARYGLTYMETAEYQDDYLAKYDSLNNSAHNVKTFISFDAPQQGANIPASFKSALIFIGIPFLFFYDSLDLEERLKEQLLALFFIQMNNPAVAQMLPYFCSQTDSTEESPTIFNSHAYRDTLLQELEKMGDYPKNLRKVAISNGNGYGIGQEISPGEKFLNLKFNTPDLSAEADLWALADEKEELFLQLSTQSEDPDINGILALFGFDNIKEKSSSEIQPYDSAPGGRGEQLKDLNDLAAEYLNDENLSGLEVNLYNDSFCYVPTISALDIETDNLFYNIAADQDILSKTPFDQIYFATTNEKHVEINATNKQFFIKEIISPLKDSIAITTGQIDNLSDDLYFLAVPRLNGALLESFACEFKQFEIEDKISYQFSLPPNLDPNNVKILSTNNSIYLTFKKSILLRKGETFPFLILKADYNGGKYFQSRMEENNLKELLINDQEAFLMGDLSGNLNLSAMDASLAARYSFGFYDQNSSPLEKFKPFSKGIDFFEFITDVNGDGDLSVNNDCLDYFLIAEASVGKINYFPIAEDFFLNQEESFAPKELMQVNYYLLKNIYWKYVQEYFKVHYPNYVSWADNRLDPRLREDWSPSLMLLTDKNKNGKIDFEDYQRLSEEYYQN